MPRSQRRCRVLCQGLGEWVGEPALASATGTEAGPGYSRLRLLSRLWRRPTTGVPAPLVARLPPWLGSIALGQIDCPGASSAATSGPRSPPG